ncbi:methyltransferase [bacterium]|nr:methyltransferase [bacterium]
MEKFTVNKLFDHELKLSQPEKGYRCSIDPFILAAHVKLSGNEKVIDIGCGCGVISCILAKEYTNLQITGIEIQEELYLCAKKNIINNKLEKSLTIIQRDIKTIQPKDIKGRADVIISNPPYQKKGSSRLNHDSQKAIARHEITLDIDSLFICSNILLKKKGRLYLIFPASRISDLFEAMGQHNFAPEFIRFVHVKKDSPARFILLCAVKNSCQPCIIHYPYNIDKKKENEL